MMRTTRITKQRTAAIALAAVLSLTAAACGQKAGVGGTVVATTETGAQVLSDGTVVDPTTGTTIPGSGGGASASGGTGAGIGGSSGSGTTGTGGGTTGLAGTVAGTPTTTGGTTGATGGGSGAGDGTGGQGEGGGSGGPGGDQSGGSAGDQGGASAGGQGGASAGGQATGTTAAAAAAAAAPGDTTGVTATTIKIGVHAPVTGAAAIPSTSFQRGVGAYFEYMNKRGGFHGRRVEVHFEDDSFDPAVAVQKCKHLTETVGVFMLFGGAGSDQIEACARYAAAAGVPYISAGVHERSTRGPLGDIPTYFASTLTYEQQAPIVTRIAEQVAAGGKKVTLRVADNSSLDNYYNTQGASLASALGGSYLAPGGNGRVPKDTSGGDALDVATKICNSGAQVVVWNASPSSLLNTSAAMPCTVTFVGPGLTNGLNIVATAGCPKLANARFLSPFPGMDKMRQHQEFTAAYAEKNGGAAPDDLGAALYGGERLIGQILQAVGQALDRESFMGKIGQQKVFQTGVYPDTSFASRFGGTAMWDLRADCNKKEFVTMGLLAP